MKSYKQLVLGLILMPCYTAIESFAMQCDNVSENTKIDANTEEKFKQIVDSCHLLSNEYKSLFLSLPSISEFQINWKEYNEKLLAEETSQAKNNDFDSIELGKIKFQAKQFFQKHLGINEDSLKKKFQCEIETNNKLKLNEVLYTIAEKVIDNGQYLKVSNFYDSVSGSVMTYCFDSEDKFPKLNELKNHIKKSSGDKTKEILDAYI